MKLIKTVFFSLLIITGYSQVTTLNHLSTLDFEVEKDNASDLWGYTSPSGKEYVLIALRTGVSIVDISNPFKPSEVKFIEMVPSFLRDIKTWDHYAYVISDDNGLLKDNSDGLLIIDLEKIDVGEINTSRFYGKVDNPILFKGHNLFIDEKGRCFVFLGSNGITYIIDVSTSPMEPKILSIYGASMHDGYVKNDTLWAATIFKGLEIYKIIDNSLHMISTTPVETRLAHNCWPSKDGKYMFLTQEVPTVDIRVFDISDPLNLVEVEKFEIHDSSMAHNIFIRGDLAFVSYYDQGIVLFDVSDPTDVKTLESHKGGVPYMPNNNARGNFGVYPYFPSGVIACSFIEGNLKLYKHHNLRYKDKLNSLTVKNADNDELIADYSLITNTEEHIYTNTLASGEVWIVAPEEAISYDFDVVSSGYNAGAVSYEEIKTNTDLTVYLEPYALGIGDFEIGSFDIYPNPTTSTITVKSQERIASVEVYDLMMRKLTSSESRSISVENLCTGAYVLLIKTVSEKVFTASFLKE